MKNTIFLFIILLPLMTLSARPGEGARGAAGGGTHFDAGTGSRYDTARNGNSDYMRNEQWRNRTYVDPGYYYGGGFANPYVDNGSGPGEVDDSDALYESYLQSNPPIPAPM